MFRLKNKHYLELFPVVYVRSEKPRYLQNWLPKHYLIMGFPKPFWLLIALDNFGIELNDTWIKQNHWIPATTGVYLITNNYFNN